MKILSIDTASQICGVSILEDMNLLVQLDENTGKTHSENLMPMIQKAFAQCHLSINDIDLLVCDKGPGSFTGIRIGIATMKAFHDSLDIPSIGINSLEALAYSIKEDGYIVSILDCKNDNCYFALYKLTNSRYVEVISPSAEGIETALHMCQQKIPATAPLTFVGDGSVIFQEFIKNTFKNCIFPMPENNYLNSYYLGLAGFSKFSEGLSEDILPLYLKKPQAQRQLEDKFKNIEILPMTLENLDEISPILLSDFDEFWNYDLLKSELTAKNSSYLIARFNNKIVGFAGLKDMVDQADIMNIVVKKDFRNQGIGGLILKHLILLAKEKCLNTIILEVMEENYPAIHLYKNFGFKQVTIRKNYYQDKNALIMSKKIMDIPL